MENLDTQKLKRVLSKVKRKIGNKISEGHTHGLKRVWKMKKAEVIDKLKELGYKPETKNNVVKMKTQKLMRKPAVNYTRFYKIENGKKKYL